MLSTVGGLAGIAAMVIGLVGLKQNKESRCAEAFSPLSGLDRTYGYGFCSQALVADDDSQLADQIEKALGRASGCDPSQADSARLKFYQLVRDDLLDKKRGGKAICETPEAAGPEQVWLRLHCLQRRFASPSWAPTDGPDWQELAGDFAAREKGSRESLAKGRLEDCEAIARAQAYQRLAAITGRSEVTVHLMAAVNVIRNPEEGGVVKLAADSLANYGLKPPPPGPKSWYTPEDLTRAQKSVAILFGNEPEFFRHHVQLWEQILPRAHVQLWFAATGVVIERFAALRSKDAGLEGDLVEMVRRLETELRDSKQPELEAAADFLLDERDLIKQGWYRGRAAGAIDDCRNGPAARRQAASATLEHLRAIYGWWTQLELSREQRSELQEEASWLNWWGVEDEITTALCGLATRRLKPEVGRLRLERLLRELPDEGKLCPFAGSELWRAAEQGRPWLTAEGTREKCSN